MRNKTNHILYARFLALWVIYKWIAGNSDYFIALTLFTRVIIGRRNDLLVWKKTLRLKSNAFLVYYRSCIFWDPQLITSVSMWAFCTPVPSLPIQLIESTPPVMPLFDPTDLGRCGWTRWCQIVRELRDPERRRVRNRNYSRPSTHQICD